MQWGGPVKTNTYKKANVTTQWKKSNVMSIANPVKKAKMPSSSPTYLLDIGHFKNLSKHCSLKSDESYGTVVTPGPYS